MTVADATATCGARKRNGDHCELPAGWGTDHVGFAQCKYHTGSTPNGRAAATNAEARALAGLTVAEEVDPGDALLWALWLAFGQLRAANEQLAGLDDPQSPKAAFWLERQEQAHDRVARFSESAMRQNVAERRLRLVERMAEHISAAAEDALSEIGGVTADQRAAFVRRFTGALATLGAGEDG